jgi:hypothetical protein
MALKTGGSTFLDDSRNYTASAATTINTDAEILITAVDGATSITGDGFAQATAKTITGDGFAFNQFNMVDATLAFASGLTHAQGSTSGYSSAGAATRNTIDKFAFASDGNATDVGDLTQARYYTAGQSSTVSGYTSGGQHPGGMKNTIDKFAFASDGNATNVGDLTGVRYTAAGQSSTISGYTSGGRTNPTGAQTFVNIIDKFPFASDGNATDVGDITLGTGRYGVAGHSSGVSGYVSQGYFVSGFSNVIEKFPFAADGNTADVGDLTRVATYAFGTNSGVSGYTSGGSGPAFTNIIDKFPFAADGNATDVGDLTTVKRAAAGQSSGDFGYSSGGKVPATSTIIDKFPFASDGNATDVGDLTIGRYGASGTQV